MRERRKNMFKNRIEAANQLAAYLKKYEGKNGVILGIPRGGIEIGDVLAQTLHQPLDMVLIKKLVHPLNNEYAIGAASMNSASVTPHSDVSNDYIRNEIERVQHLLKKKYEFYVGDRNPIELEGKIVILVDDGIATGRTIKAAIDIITQQNPAKIVVAVPVAPAEAINDLREKVDEVICLLTPNDLGAISLHYGSFSQVSDEKVKKMLLQNIET